MNTDSEGYEGSRLREIEIEKKKSILKLIELYREQMRERYYTDQFFNGVNKACNDIIKILERRL